MRDVAQDPAEFDNLGTQLLGHRRLLRGRVEQLTPLAAVVVHLDTECGAHLFGFALDDGPVVAGPPSHRQALATRPADQPGRLESSRARSTVSWVSSRCEGPRSVEAPSNSANGPLISGRRVVRLRDPQIRCKHQHPRRRDQRQQSVPGACSPTGHRGVLVVARRGRRSRRCDDRGRERVRAVGIEPRRLLGRLRRAASWSWWSVVVVEVSGAFSSSFAHAAESPTKAMIAAAPAMAGMRRAERRDVMIFLSVPRLA